MKKKASTSKEIIAILKKKNSDLKASEAQWRHTEKQLRIIAEKYRILLDFSPLGIAITDQHGNIIESSEMFIRFAEHYLKSEYIRKTIFDTDLKIIRPDGRILPIKDSPSVTALRENRTINNQDIGVVVGKDQVIWLSISAAPIPIEGYGVVIAYKDINEHRKALQELAQSRQLLEKIFATLRDAVFLIDAATLEIVYCNPAVTQIFGYTVEDMIGRKPQIVGVDDARLQKLKVRLEEKGFLYLPRFELKRKNGHSFPADTNVMPIESETGKHLYWAGVVRDVSEQLENEENLEAQKEQLRALALKLETLREEERGHIARELHDQFGQAFTSLKMETSFIAKRLRKDDKFLQEKVRSMSEMIDMNLELVRNLSTNLRPSILDDLGLVATLEWQASDFEKRTGISCNLNAEPTHINLEKAVATAVFRVSQEALTNVVRHADASHVKIRLKKTGNSLNVEIRDDGKGVSKRTLANKQSLGITGMNERISLLGGVFTIKSTPGKGTAIRVRIPLRPNSAPAD